MAETQQSEAHPLVGAMRTLGALAGFLWGGVAGQAEPETGFLIGGLAGALIGFIAGWIAGVVLQVAVQVAILALFLLLIGARVVWFFNAFGS